MKSSVFSANVSKLICCHISELSIARLYANKHSICWRNIHFFSVWCLINVVNYHANQTPTNFDGRTILLNNNNNSSMTTLPNSLAFEWKLLQFRAISCCLDRACFRRWKFSSRKFSIKSKLFVNKKLNSQTKFCGYCEKKKLKKIMAYANRASRWFFLSCQA